MRSEIDLHTHSTASDGALSPSALVQRAAESGVRRLAVTDHDTLDGLEEADAAARRHDVELVPGVEISVTWCRRTLHVVGLAVDPADARLRRGLHELVDVRCRRAQRMAEKLARAGVDDALGGARRVAGGRVPGRVHFARLLVEQGVVPDVQTAFRRYLRRGKPGYASTTWAPLEEAVSWIRGAGGVAVLAHPLKYGMTNVWLRRTAEAFRQAGGDGIEVVSGLEDAGRVSRAAALARRFALAGSVGSDFHEPGRPWQEVGRLRGLPVDVPAVWAGW